MNFSKLCCLRRLHPDLEGRVTARTLARYRKEIDAFLVFVEAFPNPMIDTPEELDHMLFYYRDEVALSRSKHNTLIAAIEFHIPRWKGQLIDPKQALKRRQISEATKHTVPFTTGTSILFAAHMSNRNSPRMGAGLIIQTETGLRPSELLSLTPETVHIPVKSTDNIVIRLGSVVSTKAKREQFVLVKQSEYPLAYKLLTAVHTLTLPGEHLFPHTYWEFRNLIVDIDKTLELDLGVSAHSGRAAFATEGVVAGKSLKALQAAGRWLSESSFKIYIDVIGAAAVGTHVKSKGYLPAIDWCCEHIDEFFGADLLRADTGRKKVSLGGQVGGALTRTKSREREQVLAPTSSNRVVLGRPETLAGKRSSQVQVRRPSIGPIRDPNSSGAEAKGKGFSSGKAKGSGRAMVVYR